MKECERKCINIIRHEEGVLKYFRRNFYIIMISYTLKDAEWIYLAGY